MDQFVNLLKNGQICIGNQERNVLISQAESINSQQGGDMEFSVIFNYEDHRTLNEMTGNGESDFC